jgi:hypothetical protein
MKTTIAATLCALLGAGLATAAAAQDDDWEFAEDPARQLTVAASRYDAGPSIIVQCRAGALTAMLIGMPAAAGTEEIQLTATRADGRADAQAWRPAGSDGVFRSSVPARDIRFLRGGGAYAVRTAEGAPHAFSATFDLPPQSANLDRVLTACGWDLADDRDQLGRARGVSLTDPDAEPFRMPRSRSRSISERSRRLPTPAPSGPAAAPRILPAEQQVSCIVRDMRLADCRVLHAPVAGEPDPADGLRRLNGSRVYGAEAAEVEGKVVYVASPSVTVIEYLATIPAF